MNERTFTGCTFVCGCDDMDEVLAEVLILREERNYLLSRIEMLEELVELHRRTGNYK